MNIIIKVDRTVIYIKIIAVKFFYAFTFVKGSMGKTLYRFLIKHSQA